MTPERDAVALLADRLRQRFCGRDGILKTPQEVRIWLPAYAALTPAMHRGASAADFKAWVDRVGEHELADEIVMAAVAIHLRLWVVVVPFTPAGASTQWQIQAHPGQQLRTELGVVASRRIILGNNDVDYVWLPALDPVGVEQAAGNGAERRGDSQ